jgi:hypothetical protein
MAGLRAPDCRAGRRPRRLELLLIMAGLVPAIHVCLGDWQRRTWMPGTSSAKTRFCPGHDDPLLEFYSRVIRSRSALPTTLTDDSAIAAAAMIGESSSPNVG